MAVPEGLRSFVPDSPQARATLRWTAKIVTLDATANGGLGFADTRGAVVLVEPTQGDAKVIGTVAFAVQALSFSGDGTALLALGDKGEAMVFDTRDGAARRPQLADGPHARPLPGPFALACSVQATSCHGIDTATGRSFAAFSGIVRTYDRLDTAPGAVLIASGKQLAVVSMPGMGYHAGSARLEDPRF
jgi:hypothetical protein